MASVIINNETEICEGVFENFEYVKVQTGSPETGGEVRNTAGQHTSPIFTSPIL